MLAEPISPDVAIPQSYTLRIPSSEPHNVLPLHGPLTFPTALPLLGQTFHSLQDGFIRHPCFSALMASGSLSPSIWATGNYRAVC